MEKHLKDTQPSATMATCARSELREHSGGPPGRPSSSSWPIQGGQHGRRGSQSSRSSTQCSNRDYAIKIARDWNLPRDGAGFVTEFEVDAEFLDRYDVHQVGGRTILEYWIPAADLDEINRHIDGQIQVVDEFR